MSDSWLECGVCHEEFREEGDLAPHVLLCGHSFCFADTTKLIKANKISCPLCTRLVTLQHYPKQFPPKNFGMVEAMQRTAVTEKKEPDKCAECETQRAVAFCISCNTAFCEPCADKIHAPRIFASHQRVTLAARPPPVLMCKTHTDEKMKLFCTNTRTGCRVPVCGLCASHGVHRGHDCRIIADVVEDLKRDFTATIDASQKWVQDLTRFSAALATSESTLMQSEEAVSVMVREDFRKAHDLLTAREAKVIEDVHLRVCAKLKTLGQLQVTTATVIADATTAHHEAKAALKVDGAPFTALLQPLVERLGAVDIAAADAVRSTIPSGKMSYAPVTATYAPVSSADVWGGTRSSAKSEKMKSVSQFGVVARSRVTTAVAKAIEPIDANQLVREDAGEQFKPEARSQPRGKPVMKQHFGRDREFYDDSVVSD